MVWRAHDLFVPAVVVLPLALALTLTLTPFAACDAPRAAGDSAPVADPRPVAPVTGSMVFSRRPAVRWRGSAEQARVQFCADRGCQRVLTEAAGEAGVASPEVNLPPGTVFWRVLPPDGAPPPGRWLPTWWFLVARGPRATPGISAAITLAGQFDADGDARWDSIDAGGFVRPAGAATASDNYLERPGLTGPVNAGDVNGDGYLDVVAADSRPRARTGEVYVYLGPIGPGVVQPSVVLAPAQPTGSACGERVVPGDFDGDGFTDLAVSCRGDGDRGRVLVFAGGPAGPGASPARVLESPGGVGSLFAALGAGDLDDDGDDELIAGAPGLASGYVGLFAGDGVGLALSPWWRRVASEAAWAGLGISAGAGDFDGDGRLDVVAGANGVDSSGGVLALAGGAWSDWARGCDPRSGALAGEVLAVGDYDGDGKADVATVMYRSDPRKVRLALYRGGVRAALDCWPREEVPLADVSELAGVRPADTDGDGVSDLVLDVVNGAGRSEQRVLRGRAGELQGP